ncbi:MAG: hypothetical protein Q9208_001366 [Pyrenodesmia sp. 3 TL-2023]
MSSKAVISSVAPASVNLELANMQLPLDGMMSVEEPKTFKQESRQRSHGAGYSTHLQFITLTNNPEVERKSTANRRAVRSNAIKHAVQERRRSKTIRSRRLEDDNTVERPPAQSENLTSHGIVTASDYWPQGEALQGSKNIMSRSLFPVGTVAAATSMSELDVLCSRK